MAGKMLAYAKLFVSELVGTWMLVFTSVGIAMTSGVTTRGVQTGADTALVACGFGFSAVAAIMCVGVYSGGHINPAVTLGAVVARVLPIDVACVYVLAQCGGSLAAAGMLRVLVPEHMRGSFGVNASADGVLTYQAFMLEMLATAVLVYTVATLTLHPILVRIKDRGVPFVVGVVILIMHVLLVPVTGCSINPARSLGPAVVAGMYGDLWIFVLAPTVGAVLGAVCAIVQVHMHRAVAPEIDMDV